MSKLTLIDQVESRSQTFENDLNAKAALTDLQDRFTTKYLLEFGDDYNDFKYRLLIQQRGYNGAILPMVGGTDPVVIKWEGDDDFYQPIKGSQCTINLMVTDSVSYDEFYAAPEKTYKVLTQWYGADPVGGPDVWNTFWSGWLVTDTFKELVSTKPYPITLTAIDGLGTIGGYKLNPAAYRPQFSSESGYPLQIKILADILRNIDLDLEIYAMHEWLQYRTNPQPQSPQNTAAFDSFITEGQQIDAKEIFEAILKSTNSRIFQSENKWCIIPNSCYDPTQWSNNISTYAEYLGYQPPAIRESKTTYLISQNAEVVEFERFNKYGDYLSIVSQDVHIAMPADVQNVGNDLVVEYLPPYKEVKMNYGIETFNKRKYQANQNQYFSYGITGYNVSEGIIGQWDYTLEDSLYSYRLGLINTNPAVYTTAISTFYPPTTEDIFLQPGVNMTLNIEYLYNTSGSLDYDFRYAIKQSKTGQSDRWWDPSSESWAFSQIVIVQEDRAAPNTYNKEWLSLSLDFTLLFEGGQLELIIFRPYDNVVRPNFALYIGKISIQAKDSAQYKTHEYKSVQAENSEVYEQDNISVEHITGAMVSPQFLVANGQLARRPRDNYATWVPTNRAQVINKEIMNDFRTAMHRYEGTIKNNHYKPLSMLNRLWINFGTSVMQLPDSCIIDTIEANLKRNAYKINMHLPNIDSDQLAVETNQFKK